MDKLVPRTTGDPRVDLILRDLYAAVNELREFLGQSASPPGQGTEGFIRVVRNGDNTYTLSLRTKDGWITATPGTFNFQDKTS